MTNAPRNGLTPASVATLFAILLLRHIDAALGGAVYEHFFALTVQLAQMAGAGWSPDATAGSYGGLSGGAPIYFWVHGLLRDVGLPWEALPVVHAVLDAGVLAVWLACTRRLPPAVVLGAGLWLAATGIPKVHLVENSTWVHFALVPAAALLLVDHRPSTRRLVGVAALVVVGAWFSRIALLAIPAMAWAGRSWEPRTRRTLHGLLGAAAVVGIAPFAAGWSGGSGPETGAFAERIASSGPGAVARNLLRLALDPLVVVGIAAWAGGRLQDDERPLAETAGVWLLCAAGPMLLLSDGGDDPYHFAAAAPARALLGGLGFAVLVRAANRAGPAILAAALVGAVALPTWRTLQEPKAADPGTGEDTCREPRLAALEHALSDAGLSDEDALRSRFRGVQADCLNAAAAWRRGLAPEEARTVVLLAGSPALPEPLVHGLAAWTGQRVQSPGADPATSPGRVSIPVPAGLVFVELDRPWGASELAPAASAGRVVVACDHVREDPGTCPADGGYVLVEGAGGSVEVGGPVGEIAVYALER
ncbi:MAG: hypothetical protein GY898_25665 [Proteobacteria bacterium]|nr:hypothetical protein [Pseudomonadota bacterium]